MSSLNVALLDESARDDSTILPALQKLLQLAYSEDTDEQLEAILPGTWSQELLDSLSKFPVLVYFFSHNGRRPHSCTSTCHFFQSNLPSIVMGISKLIERHSVSASSFGPLCHTLSRLAASEQRAVVAYATRGIKLLVLEDALRPQASVAGIPSVLGAALKEWEDDTPCVREILGALQTLCYDKATVLAVVSAGAVGPVLELLNSKDLDLKILSTAVAANILSFSDSLLLTNESCIEAFSDSMPDLLEAARSEEGMVREYGVAAVANACAHPVLAGRAKELGAIAQMRALLGNSEASHSLADNTRNIRTNLVGRRQRAETVLARLTGKGYGSSGSGGRGGGGDIEEGGEGASKVRLQFYTFKWGTKPSISFTMSPKDWVWAIAAFCFWSAIVSAVLRPIMTF